MEIVKNYNLDTFILDENGKIFDNYVKTNFDFSEHGINLKYYHTLRVAKMSKEIGGMIGLDQALCYVLGLLHDYARFPQWTSYHSFVDKDSFDHADRACQLLFDEGHIKDFKVKEDDYFLLNMAIKFHNKLGIDEPFLREQMELQNETAHSFDEILAYCKLIRDTDKLDLFNLIGYGKLRVLFDKDGYTPACLERLRQHKLVLIGDMQTKLDRIFCFIAFLFDLYYKETLQQINLDNYFAALDEHYGKMLNTEDRQFLQQIMAESNEYLKSLL